MKKIVFVCISLSFLLISNVLANSASDYKKFKRLITKHKYDDAMNVYTTKINGLETNQYQGYIFKKVIKLMKDDLDKSKVLLKTFLDVEFDNDFAMYLLSQIEFNQNNYVESMEILFNLKNKYLSDKFLNKVIDNYNNTIETYLSVLLELKDFTKINELLYTFASYNDSENLNNTYELFFDIYKNNIKDSKILEAIKSLYIANKEFMLEDIELRFIKTINTTIKKYTKSFYKEDKIQELEDLLILVTQYDNINHIQEVQKYLNRLKEKEKLSEIYKKEIDLRKHGNNYLINVSINGIALTFMLDTGASYSAINISLLENIEYTIKKNITMNTANGLKKEKLIEVSSFNVDDIILNNYLLVTLSKDMKDYDGLLGMNFLKKFDFHLDQENSILRLSGARN